MTGQSVSERGALHASSRETRYVNRVGRDGWLQVRPRDSTLNVALPKYTKVAMLEASNGRTFFEVLDGAARGRVVSLADANVGTHLGSKAPLQSAASIVITYGEFVKGWVSLARGGKLNQHMATLVVAGISVQVTMNSVWDFYFTPLPPGAIFPRVARPCSI